MIARLKGKVVEKTLTSLVVDVQGVGYLVSVPISTSSNIIEDQVDLFIHTEVREDCIKVFGFLSIGDCELF